MQSGAGQAWPITVASSREGIQNKTILCCSWSCVKTDLFCCSHEQQDSREEPAELEETLGCLDEDAWE